MQIKTQKIDLIEEQKNYQVIDLCIYINELIGYIVTLIKYIHIHVSKQTKYKPPKFNKFSKQNLILYTYTS